MRPTRVEWRNLAVEGNDSRNGMTRLDNPDDMIVLVSAWKRLERCAIEQIFGMNCKLAR